mmetsp:Transcript_37727/g.43089  ORF Transcript_37727/g.43089 Transcript_37727/m.43089 type:complete len:285 (+) Transcript_37727:55-909(+)
MSNQANIIAQDQKKWDKKFDLLIAFKEREGHCNVPQSHKEAGTNLGVWLTRQRKLKRDGRLDFDLKELLEDIGVTWEILPDNEKNMYQLLVQFQHREGHCNIPVSHKEDGIGLGSWLCRQRSKKRDRKLDLTLEKQLEDMGVMWDIASEQSEKYYRLLDKFRRREGHCNVPQHYSQDGINLGTWLCTQRHEKNCGTLDHTLEKRLDELGVVWNLLSEHWEKNYQALVKFRQREGHCNVRDSHKEDNLSLGVWLCRQQYLKREGKLDCNFQKRLEDNGVVWSSSA